MPYRNFLITSSGTGGTVLWPTGTLAMGGLVLTGLGQITNLDLITPSIRNGALNYGHGLRSAATDPEKTATFPDATGNVVLDTATQTLTNKTLTSPVLTTPTFTDPTTVAIAIGSINLGHASDTTIARSAAGIATVEGRVVECSLYGVKSADQTKTNDAVMADDAEMTVSLTAGTWKVFIMAIYANLNASSQPQGKIVFSGTYTTAAGTLEMGAHSAAGIRGSYPNNTDADLFAPTFATTAQNAWFFVEGVIVATGTGTCAWKWSQYASSANSITLKKGSVLIATKLA